MRRRTLAIVLLGSVVASAAAGWIAARSIRSPAEVAARTASPDASPILVPVEHRVLSSDIVTRGSARFGSPQQLLLAPSALKSGPVVDTLPSLGEQLTEGSVVMRASGRPVFLLQGSQPSFRDLGPGLEGDDVRQLEDALARLGHAPGPVDGVYDSSTEAAVVSWYAAAGYAPVTATDDQLAAIRALEVELVSARVDMLAAQDTVAAAERDLAAAEVGLASARVAVADPDAVIRAAEAEALAGNATANAAVILAQTALDEARYGSPGRPGSASEIAVAEADLVAAQVDQENTRVAGARSVNDARRTLDTAPGLVAAARADAAAAVLDAQARLDSAAAEAGIIESDPGTTPTQLVAARSAVTAAEAALDAARLAGDRAVAGAEQALSDAGVVLAEVTARAEADDRAAAVIVAARQSAVDAARSGAPTAPGGPGAVNAAAAGLQAALAHARSSEAAGSRLIADAWAQLAGGQADVLTREATVRAARRSLELARLAEGVRSGPVDAAELTLGLSTRRAGVQVPADEIVFVPVAPVRVSELLTSRGSSAAGPVLAVTDAVVFIDGSLALDESGLVSVGSEVTIDEPDLGINTVGVVSQVADAPGTNGLDGFHVYMEILINEPPANLVGASVRLRIAAESSGDAVLAVPTSALTLNAGGDATIEVHRDGQALTVVVEPGLSASGYVEIRPLDASVQAGDLVRVGYDLVPGAEANSGV